MCERASGLGAGHRRVCRGRWPAGWLIAALLTAFALGCPGEPPPPASDRATISLGRYYWPGMYWIDLAAHHGWFREAGLDVRLVDTTADYNGSLGAVARGELDSQTFYMFDFVRYNVVHGADLVAVLNNDASHGMEAVVARAGIDSLRELRGRKVGVARGTYLEYFLELALRSEGLELSDLEIVDRPRPEGAGEDLETGMLDAVVTWEPVAGQAQKAVRGTRLIDSSALPRAQVTVQVFRRSFIERRPQDVQALVSVWRRATRYVQERPREAFATIAEIYDTTPSDVATWAAVDRILDLEDNRHAFTFGAGLDSLHGGWAQAQDFLLRRGLAPRPLDSTRHIEPRFVRELR